MTNHEDSMAKEAKGGPIEVTRRNGSWSVKIQTVTLLSVLTALGMGTYNAIVPRQVSVVSDSHDFQNLKATVSSHHEQQRYSEAKQERIDAAQDAATAMLSEGIVQGFRSMEGRLARMEATLDLLARQQPKRTTTPP